MSVVMLVVTIMARIVRMPKAVGGGVRRSAVIVLSVVKRRVRARLVYIQMMGVGGVGGVQLWPPLMVLLGMLFGVVLGCLAGVVVDCFECLGEGCDA